MRKSLSGYFFGLFLCLAVLFLGFLFWVNSRNGQNARYLQNEQQKQLEQTFATIIHLQEQNLKTHVQDYTLWNDMIAFSKTGDPEWAKFNVDVSIPNYKFSYIWIFNDQGQPTYLVKNEELPVIPLPGLSAVKTVQDLFKDQDNCWMTHYFASQPDGTIYEIRGAWLQEETDRERITPAQGYYFVAIIWDDPIVVAFDQLLGGKVTLVRPGQPAPLNDDDSVIAIAQVLPGLNQEAVATLHAKVKTPLLRQLAKNARESTWLLISFAALFMSVLIITLFVIVIKPLREISQALATNEVAPLRRVRELHNEFGTMARLIVDYQAAIIEKEKLQANLFQAGKMASLGVLGAGVAHELNNPLTVILGYADYLARAIKQGTLQTASLEQQLDAIKTHAMRMRTIINHIREFSRTETGEQHTREEINDLIRQALILLRESIKSHGIQLEEVLAPELPPIHCDRIKIESLLQNLILNAKDALEEVDDDRPQKITISSQYDAKEDKISIRVADNANGIPEAARTQVFDPFFTTKPVGKGTGLGLALVTAIAQEHGGSVTFETKLGQGTVFTVYLASDNNRRASR